MAEVIEFSGKVIPWIPFLFVGLWLIVKIFRFAFGRGFVGNMFRGVASKLRGSKGTKAVTSTEDEKQPTVKE